MINLVITFLLILSGFSYASSCSDYYLDKTVEVSRCEQGGASSECPFVMNGILSTKKLKKATLLMAFYEKALKRINLQKDFLFYKFSKYSLGSLSTKKLQVFLAKNKGFKHEVLSPVWFSSKFGFLRAPNINKRDIIIFQKNIIKKLKRNFLENRELVGSLISWEAVERLPEDLSFVKVSMLIDELLKYNCDKLIQKYGYNISSRNLEDELIFLYIEQL